MEAVNWLDGEANKGKERICPRRHILQSEWQPVWNNYFQEKNKYDNISDYECIFPRIDDLAALYENDQHRWHNLQVAKMRGFGIRIQNIAHFTSATNAEKIEDSGGFIGGIKKINENQNGRPVRGCFSWWSPIFRPDDISPLRQHLMDVLTPFCGKDIERISPQFASSDAFVPNPLRYGEVYFPQTIENVCNSYRAYIGSEDLQFKVLGTFLYKQEIMHAVFVCGAVIGDILFSDYPEIPIQEAAADHGHDAENADQGNVVVRDDDGNWMWYPQATGTKIMRLDPEIKCPKYRRWEHVAFAFHMPPVMRVGNLERRNLNDSG